MEQPRASKDYPTDFRFGRQVEASKKRRAEKYLEDASKELSMTDQIQSPKALIVSFYDREEDRLQEMRDMLKEIEKLNELKGEVRELKELLQKDKAGKQTYAQW
ncbi:hypothetical protein LTS16_026965 [Friedmanniomyces endolithicus]|uniref:Uncharacterized protein n=2 Tax=Friedmanniomyces endolithicus TaxID=329885 RepID=A0A4U0TPE5_9PEZI|nr:hypothetical protein LTS09_017930 [Friedmanniomyces endolithicus]KAK0888838.1 hypothetical protein LTR57_025481 [Friedmanniomyces endolithicus]KAK0950495.1 hypothetical protein LTS01_025577 [Friedmanniomyces endolithicus]KAK1020609.1 hypothetical protein LTS16_026965 [Friedmanniomyces endolithicus]KAK1085531.1 hypothetical protein LTR33_002040 [Friedmanniomyces endolithicus]